jgi:hypothetical protein
MDTLALHSHLAHLALSHATDAAPAPLSSGSGVCAVVLTASAIALYLALRSIGRALEPLRQVIRSVVSAAVAAALVLIAFLLVLVSIFSMPG